MLNKALLIVIAVIVGLALYSNRLPVNPDSPITPPSASLLSAPDFRELIKDPKVFVLDVHTPEQDHLPGTDAFIPDTEVGARLAELPSDKSTPIAIYCRSGNMSSNVAKLLLKEGYTNVSDLEGGTKSYKMHVNDVVLTPATQELGTVIYGDVATTSLTLTNYTDQPLTITRLTTSCSCTSAELDSMTIASYKSAKISVSFDPSVHKDDTDLGDLTRTIYLETDNLNFQKLEASFTATVIKE